MTMTAGRGIPAEMAEQLDRWRAEGLLTEEQFDRIVAAEAARMIAPARPTAPTAAAGADAVAAPAGTAGVAGNVVPPAAGEVAAEEAAAEEARSAPPAQAQHAARQVEARALLAEGLGYFGGALIAAAAVRLAGQYWPHLPLGGRLAVTGVPAVALLVAGAAVPARLGDAGRRLRAVLWAVSAGLTAAMLGILAADGFGWQAQEAWLFAVAVGTGYAAVLWHRLPSALLHVLTFAGLAATAGIACGDLWPEPPEVPGLALWAFSLLWLLLSLRRIVPTRAGSILGSGLAVVSAQTVASNGWGHLLALATVAGVVTLAVWIGDLPMLVIGSLGAFRAVPATLAWAFPGSLAASLGLLAVGALLVGAGLYTIRRRAGTDQGTGSRSG